MKIVIILAILVFCVLLGMGFAGYYKRRRVFFEELKSFNLKFLSCLEFSADPLAEFVGKVKDGFSADFAGLLSGYLGWLAGGENAEECLKGSLARLPLSREERERVREYFVSLGGCDCYTERERCSEYKAVFEGMAEAGLAEEKKNGALSVKLSVYLGLLVVVLII